MNRAVHCALPWILPALLLASGCNIAATGHNVQGKRLYEQGQFAQAISTFQKAVNANPRNPDAYYNMASTYYYLGKQQNNATWTQQAEQLYRRALVIDPNHTDAHRGLAAVLVESGRSGEAFQMLQAWQARAPFSAEPLIELARLQSEFGNRSNAMQTLANALNVDSNNPRALKAMGLMREQSGEYQLALDNYIRSYQANNLQPDVAEKIARLQGSARPQVVPFQPGQNRLGSAQQYVPR